MKWLLGICLSAVALLVLTGCHRDHAHGDSDHGHAHGADGGHSHSAQSFSGATYEPGIGITLLDETRDSIGIQITEVQETVLPRQIRFAARVFTSKDDEASTTQMATGFVSSNMAALLQPGMPVEFITASGVAATGTVQKIYSSRENFDPEIIVALANPPDEPPLGAFGEITASVPDKTKTLIVPRNAVIKSVTGHFVYVVNGDAFTLTHVELGTEVNDLLEVTDGLQAGDKVVTRGVMDLWFVELRANKGGQGYCPAPAQKGKG